MKKIVLNGLAVTIIAVSMASCQGSKTSETTKDSTITVKGDTTKTITTTTETVKTEAPKFSSEEVNKGIAEFNHLKDDYLAALKSKNAIEIANLTSKYNDLSKKASTWAAKLKPDELKKYADYMGSITKDWAEASKKTFDQK